MHAVFVGVFRHLKVRCLAVEVVAGNVVDKVDPGVGHQLVLLIPAGIVADLVHILACGRPEDGDENVVVKAEFLFNDRNGDLFFDVLAVFVSCGVCNGRGDRRAANGFGRDHTVFVNGGDSRICAFPADAVIQLVNCRNRHLDAVAFANGQLQRALAHIHCKIVCAERAECGQLRQLHNIGSVVCGICALRHIQPDVGSLHRFFQIKADRRAGRFLTGDLYHIRPVLAVGRNLQLIVDWERIAILAIVRAREDHKAAELIRQAKVNACVRDRIRRCALNGQRRPAVRAAVADDASDIAVVQQHAAPDALRRNIVGRNADHLVQRCVFRAFGLPCAQVIAARRAKHRKLRQLHHGSAALCHIDPDILCRDRRLQIEEDRRSGRGLTRHRDEICPGLAVVRGLKHIVHREFICVFAVRAREYHDPADLIRRTEVDGRPCNLVGCCPLFKWVRRPAVRAVRRGR